MLIKPSFPRMIRVCKEAGNSQRSGKSFVKAELFAIIESESLNKFWGDDAESLMGSKVEFGGGTLKSFSRKRYAFFSKKSPSKTKIPCFPHI
jgi:hypothetical protein